MKKKILARLHTSRTRIKTLKKLCIKVAYNNKKWIKKDNNKSTYWLNFWRGALRLCSLYDLYRFKSTYNPDKSNHTEMKA